MVINDLEYLVGLILADGNINKRDYKITIYTKNENFKETVKNKLRNLTQNKVSERFHNGVFEISLTDKKFSQELSKNFDIPLGKKAAKIEIASNLTVDQKVSLVTGYFDGDGSVYKR